jgi:hypothetical protein
MSTQKEFTSGAALQAVAENLKVDINKLTVSLLPINSGEPYQVKSVSLGINVLVHENKKTASEAYQSIVGIWLANGGFFKEMKPTIELFRAVAGHCKPADLAPWLAMRAREGWVLKPKDLKPKELGSLENLIRELEVSLAEDLRDPLAALLRITGVVIPGSNLFNEDGLALATSVLLEQCDYKIPDMLKVIVEGYGGWEKFSLSGVVATSDEGYLIEAFDDPTADMMLRMYEGT